MNKPTNMPGFDAEASLGPALGIYRVNAALANFSLEGSGGVVPQFRIQSGQDLGAYWRCRVNGGGDLICRFFGGLPPFTIGGLF